MSRTFRRKNYENEQGHSWGRRGSKVNGYYTEEDYSDEYDANLYGIYKLYRTGRYYFYRPMTEVERNQAWKRIHTDRSYCRGPSKWFRFNEEKHMRSVNKQELIRFMKNHEYEVMAYAMLYLPYWD